MMPSRRRLLPLCSRLVSGRILHLLLALAGSIAHGDRRRCPGWSVVLAVFFPVVVNDAPVIIIFFLFFLFLLVLRFFLGVPASLVMDLVFVNRHPTLPAGTTMATMASNTIGKESDTQMRLFGGRLVMTMKRRKAPDGTAEPCSGVGCGDRLSSLPDELIGRILSFLPTLQAALTAQMSRRAWAHVSALNLSVRDCVRRGKGPRFCALATAALARFPTPGIPAISVEVHHHIYLVNECWAARPLDEFLASCCRRLRTLRLRRVRGHSVRRLALRTGVLEVLDLDTVDDLATLDVVAAKLRCLSVSSCFRLATDGDGGKVTVSAPRIEAVCWYRSYPEQLTFRDSGLAHVRRLASPLKILTFGRWDQFDAPYTTQLLRSCALAVDQLDMELVVPDEMALLNWLGDPAEARATCEDAALCSRALAEDPVGVRRRRHATPGLLPLANAELNEAPHRCEPLLPHRLCKLFIHATNSIDLHLGLYYYGKSAFEPGLLISGGRRGDGAAAARKAAAVEEE
ncbi:unnamed protein product [Miscanthus lutarioriparius]|uniref:F-box domain-containing protein n=1 Tax=Miscanthus lutarioriparius TaxID=422564 RepID=A0A811S8J1_9POAL|nr:unnamed protein product [Miscanthus lutarioriparius]